MLKVYTDAAVKGNPGKAGIGFVVLSSALYEQVALPLHGSNWDNHLAEMEAVKQAVLWLLDKELTDEMLFLYSDSKIAVDALNKAYAKNPIYQEYVDSILSLLENFPVHVIEWLPEKANKGADNLARQGLRKA